MPGPVGGRRRAEVCTRENGEHLGVRYKIFSAGIHSINFWASLTFKPNNSFCDDCSVTIVYTPDCQVALNIESFRKYLLEKIASMVGPRREDGSKILSKL